jgi:hypothetical protein
MHICLFDFLKFSQHDTDVEAAAAAAAAAAEAAECKQGRQTNRRP